jgi:putative ABC transport system permease protein
MNYLNLAFQSIRRNARAYLAYFLNCVVFVVISFLSEMLLDHPWFEKYFGNEHSLGYSSLTFNFFFLVFLIFSISFFLQARKKEIALYALHGATWWQISSIIFLENIIIGLSTIVTGIVLGLSLSKLIFILLAPVVETPVFPFYFPLEVIWETTKTFGSLFLINSLVTILFIRSQKAITLLKRRTLKTNRTKHSLVILLVTLALLRVVGYIYYQFQQKNLFTDISFTVFIYVASITAGYLIFRNFGSLLYLLFKRSDPKHPVRLLWGTQQQFQTKAYTIAGFLAALFFSSAISSTVGVITDFNKQLLSYQDYPFTYYLVANKPDNSELPVRDRVLNQQLKQAKVKYQSGTFDALVVRGVSNSYTRVVRYSDYQTLTKILGRANPSSLQNNEVLYLASLDGVFMKQKNQEKIKDLRIVGSPTTFQLRQGTGNLIPGYDVIVVSDATYAKLATIKTYSNSAPIHQLSIERYIVYLVPEWMKSPPQFLTPADNVYKKVSALPVSSEGSNIYARSPYQNGSTVILGIFSAIITFFAGVSFLYFRSYVQLGEEQEQYRILAKLGWSGKEMRRLGTMQIAYLFFVPFGLASILCLLFNENKTVYMLSSIGIQLGLLIIYFLLARLSYLRKVVPHSD